MIEVWQQIFGFEGFFSISNTAQVLSETREIPWNGTIRRVRPRILAQHKDSQGYLRVTLAQDSKLYSKLIHVLLLESFISPRPDGKIGCHRDDDKLNNDLSNFYWGTYKQNSADCVRNGKHPLSKRTHCANGHEYTPENTYQYRNKNKRLCRLCHRKRARETAARSRQQQKAPQ